MRLIYAVIEEKVTCWLNGYVQRCCRQLCSCICIMADSELNADS